MLKLYEKSLHQKIENVEDEFFNSPYEKQIRMYRLALEFEYYELLAQLHKRLKDLPEDFLNDVENLKL